MPKEKKVTALPERGDEVLITEELTIVSSREIGDMESGEEYPSLKRDGDCFEASHH